MHKRIRPFIVSVSLSVTALLAVTQAQADRLGDVFYIALENHNWTQPGTQSSPMQIYGNAAAPYINSLVTPGNANAAQVSFAMNYQNAGVGIHPSLPNYLWHEAGSNFGVFNDSDPYANGGANNQSTTNHLTGYLQAAGISWKNYQEDTDLVTDSGGHLTSTVKSKSQYTVPLTRFSGTSSAYTNPYNGSHQYDYAPKHNPSVYFTDTNGGNDATSSNPEAQFYAPLQDLQTDLTNNTVAKYNWITPDQLNDMHTGLNGGFTYHGTAYTGDAANIAQGDNFLSIVVPEIMSSSAYQHNGAIVLWWDETEDGDDATRTIGEIVISKLAKGNAYSNNIRYTHSSDLITLQKIFGVGPLNGIRDAGNATDLSDLFQAGTIPAAVPEPAPVAGFGVAMLGLVLGLRKRTK